MLSVRKLYSKINLKNLKKIYRSLLEVPASIIAGLDFPPCYEKIVSFHRGTVFPETELKDFAQSFGDLPLVMSAGPCLTFNGVDEYGTFDAITLVGDFSVSFGIDEGTDGVIIGTRASGLNRIEYYKATGSFYVNINGTFKGFSGFQAASTLYTLSRVGSVVTISNELGASETLDVTADDFICDGIGRYNFNTRLLGQLWNIRIKDSTQDIHFPCSELSGATIYSSDYLNDGIYGSIVSTDIPAVRAGRQDNYFSHNVDGWYEITGDPVYYPYPVAGYNTHHRPNTWNNSPTTIAFKERPVGTFDGVGDFVELSTPVNVESFHATIKIGDIASNEVIFYSGTGWYSGEMFVVRTHSATGKLLFIIYSNGVEIANFISVAAFSNGDIVEIDISNDGSTWFFTVNSDTLTSTYTGTNNGATFTRVGREISGSYFTGYILDATINGTLIRLDEGEGTDIKDSNGNSVGTLGSTDVPAFWANTMLPQAIIDADAAYSYFSDANYHAVAKTQVELETDGVVNANDQYFFGSISPKPPSLLVYDQPQTEPCLGDILVHVGEVELATIGTLIATDENGNNLYL